MADENAGTSEVLEPPNPVHMTSGPQTRWSTVNFGEAMQGVLTPFSWAIWTGMEDATRRSLASMGVLTKAEAPPPESADGRMSGIYYGRSAGNINFFRMVGARMPGSNPDVLEEKVFGEVTDTPLWGEPGGWARSVAIAAKFPVEAFRSPRQAARYLDEVRIWWRRNTFDAPPQTLDESQALVRAAAARFITACTAHATISVIGPQTLAALTDLAESATGDASLGTDLATGYGGMEETALIADLWATSQGRLSLDQFLRVHGFHGPYESKLESRSWREDPTHVESIVRGYRDRGVTDPRDRERERVALRQAAATRVLAALPRHKRPAAKFAMKLASIFIPARELGKAGFLHALDGARCGARATGLHLAELGVLADPEDAFFLTCAEITGKPDRSFLELTAERKANHERYLGLDLPPAWNGNPVPIVTADASEYQRSTQVQGIGVVGAKVTGRARVIDNPMSADLDPGDILVCATTDPSWTPLFMLADALVIDTGGQMSHGAIVARELGVCCVINTVTGTKDIPDGATITVDGTTGVVEVVG